MDASLPKELSKQPFSLKDALNMGLSRSELKRLQEEGVVQKLARGLYAPMTEDWTEEDEFRAATTLVGEPSAICLFSALSFYHLTDLIPNQTWIMVPAHKRSQYENLRLFRCRDPRWKIGIKKENGYYITSIERTIVDSLRYQRLIGTNTATEALRQSVEEEKVKVQDLWEMSKHLKSLHRTRPYLEMLL